MDDYVELKYLCMQDILLISTDNQNVRISIGLPSLIKKKGFQGPFT
jgi:hypothetical protein